MEVTNQYISFIYETASEGDILLFATVNNSNPSHFVEIFQAKVVMNPGSILMSLGSTVSFDMQNM